MSKYLPEPWQSFSLDSEAILSELASAYRNKLDAFRELIGNAFDADAFTVSINLSDESQITIDDDGIGLESSSQYTQAGNLHKKDEKQTPKLRRMFIGRKGIGRLAINMLGKESVVSSNNDKKIINIAIKFNENGVPTYQLIENTPPNYSKTYRGTKIIIKNLKTSIRESELTAYLRETFIGVMNPINSKDYPLSIFINGNKLTPIPLPNEIVGRWSTSIGFIEYWLKPEKSRKTIGILWRGTHIKSWIGLDNHPCSGSININFLDPDPSRGDFKDIGDEKQVFENELRKLIMVKIPRRKREREDELDDEAIKNFQNLLKLLKSLGYQMPEGKKTSSKIGDEEKGILRRDIELNSPLAIPTGKGLEKKKRDNINKRIKRWGVEITHEALGRDSLIIHTDINEKTIIWNTDHPITKTIRKQESVRRKVIEYPLLLEGLAPIFHPVETLSEFRQWRDDVLLKAFPNVGKKMTDEARRKLSIARTGMKFTAEHKIHLSQSHRGIPHKKKGK